MKASSYHTDWYIKEGIKQPFDAVFLGTITKGKNQAGYYPAKTYTYTKEFEAPAQWVEKTVLVEFEGVTAKALVYLNNRLLACHQYGYSSFFIDMSGALRFDQKNTL